MTKPLRFGIVAGEKSGDLLGADLIKALRLHYPAAEFFGVGGPAMLALGCESLVPMERLSVMGFVEPLGRLPELLRLKRNLQDAYIQTPPAAFIGIDSPDFNLRLETRLREHHIKTVHYVSPSVWAYRAKRIVKIKQAVDLMLTLFPFETGIYHQHEIAVVCVGHPLADQIGFEDTRAADRAKLGLAGTDNVIALLPGSRGSEIKRLGPIFLAAAVEALQRFPELKYIIPVAGAEARIQINNLLHSSGILGSDQFQLVDDSHAAMSAANLVVMASGTATLEAMLLRRPMIVCYKLAAISYAIASRLVKIPYVALPNLLAGKQLVPELMQYDLTVEALGNEINSFLKAIETGDENQQQLLQEFDEIHRGLRMDASASAASAIKELLETH
ncbi:MAG: lipid-A-disaccharide synthase [Proteobacteria bacterium]|nr:lipid-A-disaccharide synthase [Pseudomonadota bacterium]